MNLYDSGQVTPEGYRDISPVAAATAISKLRFVDVREPSEFVGELGHIPGSQLVPLATVPDHLASWPREDAIILVCRSGARSGRAAALLVSIGFTKVMNLAGGMLAYRAANLPTERS